MNENENQLTYSWEKNFSQEEVEALFLSVGWVSGQYPERLHKALMNSSAVLTVRDGGQLVALARLLDDGGMLAFMHYVLVAPTHQGRGIAGRMMALIKERYADYLYIALMPEESSNAAFYEKYGFARMPDGVPMICKQL